MPTVPATFSVTSCSAPVRLARIPAKEIPAAQSPWEAPKLESFLGDMDAPVLATPVFTLKLLDSLISSMVSKSYLLAKIPIRILNKILVFS